jgi:hypothetical protein
VSGSDDDDMSDRGEPVTSTVIALDAPPDEVAGMADGLGPMVEAPDADENIVMAVVDKTTISRKGMQCRSERDLEPTIRTCACTAIPPMSGTSFPGNRRDHKANKA